MSEGVHPYSTVGLQISDPALTTLVDIYDKIAGLRFEEAICRFDDLLELIGDNPKLADVVDALRKMIEGERVFNRLRGIVLTM